MVAPSANEDAAFSQEAIQVLADAFQQACSALNIPGDAHHERDVVADRIIELASTGVIDAAALCERVVSEAKSASEQT